MYVCRKPEMYSRAFGNCATRYLLGYNPFRAVLIMQLIELLAVLVEGQSLCQRVRRLYQNPLEIEDWTLISHVLNQWLCMGCRGSLF